VTGVVPALAAPDGPQRYVDEVFPAVEETAGIPYADDLDHPGEALALDLFVPAGDTATDRPVVIWVHGGGFTGGSRTGPPIRRLAEAFARRGFVSASISYRLSDAEGVPAIRRAVADLRAAVRWFRANQATGGHAPDHPLAAPGETLDLGIDPDRIVVGGYSAGAVTSLSAAFEAGPDEGSNPGWPSTVAAAVSLAGAGLSDGVGGDPPALMFHGTEDTRVPYEGAVWSGAQTCRVARYFGTDCVFVTLDGVGHQLFDDGPLEDGYHATTAHFLTCRVGASGAASDLAPWYELAAGWAVRTGVAAGFPDGTFRGGETVTRGQAVGMLWRLVGEPAEDRPHGFPDVGPALAPAVRWAAATGVLAGFADGTAGLGRPVTRGQAARMLHRSTGAVGVSDLPPLTLRDVPRRFVVPVRWLVAPRDVQLLAGGGIGSGYPDRTFRPDRSVTRAQFVRWLHGTALAGSAWAPEPAADPPPAACFRLGDPPEG